jgi:hypothetical protein
MSVFGKALAAHLVIFFDAHRPLVLPGFKWVPLHALASNPGPIYLNGSFAGPRIVLNGGAVACQGHAASRSAACRALTATEPPRKAGPAGEGNVAVMHSAPRRNNPGTMDAAMKPQQ